jgi:hypothetical protein
MAFYVCPSERNGESSCDFQNLVNHIVFGAESCPGESSLGGDARLDSLSIRPWLSVAMRSQGVESGKVGITIS